MTPLLKELLTYTSRAPAKVNEGFTASLKADLLGKTKTEVTKLMKANGLKKIRSPGETAREASYMDVTGGFPAYVSVYFDSTDRATRVAASS